MAKNKQLYPLAIFFVLSMLSFAFQNCSDVNFASSSGLTSSEGSPDPAPSPRTPSIPDQNAGPGLAGGHFDLDTASQVYPLGSGTTDKHEHEYDDKYDVTFVDFLNMASGFTRIADRVSSSRNFYIIVANAQLSPGGMLEINGSTFPVTDYQQKVSNFRSLLPTHTLSTLTSFKIHFDRDVITQGGLIGTVTNCVRSNEAGANGEYRNGALTIQILDANAASLNPATGTASASGGLLWEATIFWHHDGGCY